MPRQQGNGDRKDRNEHNAADAEREDAAKHFGAAEATLHSGFAICPTKALFARRGTFGPFEAAINRWEVSHDCPLRV